MVPNKVHLLSISTDLNPFYFYHIQTNNDDGIMQENLQGHYT